MKVPAAATPLLIILLVSACVTSEERRPASGPVSVRVINNNYLDMNVYAVAGSTTDRLGTVRSNGDQTFEISEALSLSGGLRVLADPIGSTEAFLSNQIPVVPGDAVQFVIQSQLGLSTAIVH